MTYPSSFLPPFWIFTIQNPDFENVRILNVSGFQMVGFQIPTVEINSKEFTWKVLGYLFNVLS